MHLQAKSLATICMSLAAMDPPDLVVIPRHRFLRNPLVFYGGLEHHAICKLIDDATLNFLPRCLMRGDL